MPNHLIILKDQQILYTMHNGEAGILSSLETNFKTLLIDKDQCKTTIKQAKLYKSILSEDLLKIELKSHVYDDLDHIYIGA